MEQRVAELESQLAFQEHTIQELNDVIIELRKEIENVHLEMNRLKDKIEDINSSTVIPLSEEKPPPHY